MTITVQIIGQDTLTAKLDALPAALQKKLATNLEKAAMRLRDYIRYGELDGQLLNVKSADLQNSIQETTTESSTGVNAKVYSSGNLPYAKPLNDGCAPYIIEPKTAKFLAWPGGEAFDGPAGGKFNAFYGMSGGDQAEMIFAKVVHHPGQWPRQFMEAGLAYQKDDIINAIAGTMKEAWVEL